MWSASRPCPVISWKRTPPKPPPTITGIAPAGASSASSSVSATRAAWSAIPSAAPPSTSSHPRCPPSVSNPVSTSPFRRATTWTPRRVRNLSSLANRPSELATVTRRRPSAYDTLTWSIASPRGPGRLVAGPQQVGLALRGYARRVGHDLLHGRWARGLERLRRGAFPAQRRRGGVGRPIEVALAQPVHVREVRRVARNDSDPGTALAPALGSLHARLVDREREARAVLAVDLGEVASPGERPLEGARSEIRFDQGLRVRQGHRPNILRPG